MSRGRQQKSERTPARVVVVGAGVMGCAAAYELAGRGVNVTVLERSVPGAEASSAAAGILGAQVESHHPGPLAELGIASRALYPKLAAQLEAETGISIGYRRSGALKVSFETRGAAALERERDWQRKAKLPLARLARAKLLAREPALSKELAGGVLFEADALLDPRALLAALRVAAERRGASFRSGAFVRGVVEREGRAVGVDLDDGSLVEGSHVVLAAGSWTSLLGAQTRRGGPRVVPARGQIVELKTSVPLLSSVVFGPECYLVPRADGRVLIGSTLEFVGFRREVTAGAVHALLGAALRLVPALAAAELSGSWSSFRPFTADELPLLGPSQLPGLILMSGHYRNGILLAPISARIVADCVQGKRPPLDLAPFAPERRATDRP
jgi:glycine oxidase